MTDRSDRAPLAAARRRLARLRRQHSYSARAEAEVKSLRTALQTQLQELRGEVDRTSRELAGDRTRIAGLEKHSDATAAGVAQMLRRPWPRTPPPPPPPRTFTGITEQNAVLVGLRRTGTAPRVVLVLNGLSVDAIFAGVRTALVTAVALARRLDRPLAVVVLEPLGADPDVVRAGLIEWMTDQLDAGDLAGNLTVSSQERPRRDDVHDADIWLVTYWTTAVQVGRLCDDGVVDESRVVYLVQDWEPGFFPWGVEYALAVSTYARDFHLLVNSTSLAGFVAAQSGRPAAELVFAPEIDRPRLQVAARAWTPGDPARPRVLFYARPSKPRNLYVLGLAALRHWAQHLPDGMHPEVTFAGEKLADPDLGPGVTVHNAGKLDFDGYYEQPSPAR